MPFSLSRRWVILIVAAAIPIVLWLVIQLFVSSQQGKFGILPAPVIRTNSYTFNKQVLQAASRALATNTPPPRKVYKVEKQEQDPSDFLKRLSAEPVTINNTVNAYQNMTSKLLITHDKSTHTLYLLPDAKDSLYQKEKVANEDEAATRCREIINGFSFLNEADLAAAQPQVEVRGDAYYVQLMRVMEKEVVWYASAHPALAECYVTAEGKITSMFMQVDQLSVQASSSYPVVSETTSVFNALNAQWPGSIDIWLDPKTTGNNYTITPDRLQSVEVKDSTSVSLLYCQEDLCYTYPGYQVQALGQISSSGATDVFPGRITLFLLALSQKYWK